MEKSVLIEVINNVGWINLNRPKVLNSLNTEMVELINRQLQTWSVDEAISFVCISGEGEKGLCAGGDMRAFYDARDVNAKEKAAQFFSAEYEMDIRIHHYPKPILVYMDGIVMGGGVGISIGCSHRIVTESTKWAMPEMNIGFFPDVGASYFLNKMPGYIGRYLALTSQIIKASDTLYTGAEDYFLERENWPAFKSEIMTSDWMPSSAEANLSNVIKKFCKPISIGSSQLVQIEEKINRHFSFDTIEEIISSLQQDKGDIWAIETAKTMLSKSPVSLKVTLHQLQAGERKSLIDCFKMEYTLGVNFMDNPDFFEGVRSVLVDKDRSPKWEKGQLNEVTKEHIASFFSRNEEDSVIANFDPLDKDILIKRSFK